ncbi:MAG: tRNA dihydrouridine synthase DusB [Firmicutes bacterium]|nr:tRNA dihydrouridine synthase DusB [Bacillota bacterium]
MNIGNVQLENPFLLGPMAGITDSPFRQLCREMGCALSYSEMVSAKALYYKDKKTERLLAVTEEELPVAYQVFGSEPEIMAFAADRLKDRKNCILDINMGCPVPKVVKNGEGSALMKEPWKIRRLVEQAVKYGGKPVTVKMRIGWDENHINVVKCAGEAEAGGAAAVAVHGRTREQYYSGKADWDAIREVRQNLSIPVIGNGDIFTAEDGLRMMDYTGCEMVMVARGALGNPWLFRELVHLWKTGETLPRPDLEEVREMMIRQLDMMAELKGERVSVLEMRKHVGWYIRGIPGAAKIRAEVNRIADIGELRRFLTDSIGK